MIYQSNSEQRVALNFLSLKENNASLTVYRKKNDCLDENLKERVKLYRLPNNSDTEELDNYLVAIEQVDGYESYKTNFFENPKLTLFCLYTLLSEKCKEVLAPSAYVIESEFRKKINFIVKRHDEGSEIIWLEPYYLRTKNEYGFLIGFKFDVKEGIPLNKSILEKSLSLTSDGKENVNYYVDQYGKIKSFISAYSSKLFPLIHNEVSININPSLREVESGLLNSKSYVFSNNKTHSSQFQGVKKYGPYFPIKEDFLICFIYLPKNKSLSYDLYYALRGDKYATFPGMKPMFSLELDKKHVMGVQIDDYDVTNIEKAIIQIKNNSQDRAVLPLLITPWSRDEGCDDYYRIKYQFLKQRIASQFVSMKKLLSRDGLKWSISNIALAIFSKLGGKPWKVNPRNEKCLIIGIGQSHRKSEGKISHYYAYSVLSDSSGLYDSIRVLSSSNDSTEYLNGLTRKMKSIIGELLPRYDKFVIHSPFKLRHEEMKAITNALEDIHEEKQFVVMKFNDKSKYFGFEMQNNSKVPYESTCLALGEKQFLIWFEGLQYHNPTVRRRISRPMNVEFVFSKPELTYDDKNGHLQDAINLSGANWRGFNAKTLPVSVYYAKLIAEYIGHFEQLGLEPVDFENMSPWFL